LCLLVLFVFFSKHLYDLKKDSADGRILIGMVSSGMVKDAPVFGCGISGFRANYMNRQADYFEKHPDSTYQMNADDVETPFNEFLKILVEQGIVGLLLFLYLLYYIFNLRLSASFVSFAFKPLLLFILIFGLFSYPFDKLPFVVLFVFFLAILSQENANDAKSANFHKLKIWIPVFIVLFFVSGKIAENAYCYAKSCRMWNKALVNFASDKEESLSQLKKLYPELENNPVFLFTYGKILNMGKHYSEAVTVLEKAVERQPISTSYIELGKSYEAKGFTDKAFACWKRAGLMVPARFTPLYLTMKLYFKNGEYGNAQECARELLEKKIKIDNPEIDRMKREAMEILFDDCHPASDAGSPIKKISCNEINNKLIKSKIYV